MDDQFKRAFKMKYKAFQVDQSNKIEELSADGVIDRLSKTCKKPEGSIDELETKIFESLDQLFKNRKSHKLNVDGEEIEPIIGYRLDREYSFYVDGHTLSDDNSIYRCITIEQNLLVVKEELVMRDRKIQEASINQFDLGVVRSSREHKAFKENLDHINEMLIQAVERKRNDGEI